MSRPGSHNGGKQTDLDDGRTVRRRANTPALGSLVCGGLALLVAVPVFPLALVLGPAAVALGVAGFRRARRLRGTGRGVALWGLMSGVIASVIALILTIAAYQVVTDPNLRDVLEDMRDGQPEDVEGAEA